MARTERHRQRPGARQPGRRSLAVASIVGIVVVALACGSLISISMTPNGPLTRSEPPDGALAIYDENNQRRWNSGTAGRGDRAIFQADGNFVVYDRTMTSVWTSNTPGHDGAVLVLEADGNVCVVYQGQVIWASDTALTA
jgi:hypothetical protein